MTNRFIIWLLMCVCSGIHGQEKDRQETLPFSLFTIENELSYRNLLLPMMVADPILGPKLQLTTEQSQSFQDLLTKTFVTFPPFDLLEKDSHDLKSFFDQTAKQISEKDTEFKLYWQEVLRPAQSDVLLGKYIVLNGLGALLHPAAIDRFSLDSSQTQKIGKLVSDCRDAKRLFWGDVFGQARKRDPKEMIELFDLRTNKSLAISSRALSDSQVKLLKEVLMAVPASTEQRLSFGF